MMKTVEIPFNKFLGLKISEKPEYIFMVDNSADYLNHVGTVHASVQFALAEATSGEFLGHVLSEYTGGGFAVVKTVEVKYTKPANGELYSSAEIDAEDTGKLIEDFDSKGKASVKVKVNIHDKQGVVTSQSVFEWYLKKV
jgi:acyl-coenzyme A thioesterase PaaI-like protein